MTQGEAYARAVGLTGDPGDGELHSGDLNLTLYAHPVPDREKERLHKRVAGLTRLVGWAIGIISNVDAPETGWPNQTDEWRDAARTWLGAQATPEVVGELSGVDQRLVGALEALGEEWSPNGVATVAARLAAGEKL